MANLFIRSRNIPILSSTNHNQIERFLTIFENVGVAWLDSQKVIYFSHYIDRHISDWYEVWLSDFKANNGAVLSETVNIPGAWQLLKKDLRKEFCLSKEKALFRASQNRDETGMNFYLRMMRLITFSEIDFSEVAKIAAITQRMTGDFYKRFCDYEGETLRDLKKKLKQFDWKRKGIQLASRFDEAEVQITTVKKIRKFCKKCKSKLHTFRECPKKQVKAEVINYN